MTGKEKKSFKSPEEIQEDRNTGMLKLSMSRTVTLNIPTQTPHTISPKILCLLCSGLFADTWVGLYLRQARDPSCERQALETCGKTVFAAGQRCHVCMCEV